LTLFLDIREENKMINAKDFNALGDGKNDDTQALQAAVDEASKTGSSVFLDAGVYMCGKSTMCRNTGLYAEPVWSYRGEHGAVIRLNDPRATCQIDLTNAFGATLNGIFLDGGRLGTGVHGLMLNQPDFSKQEESFRIERCRISSYSGDGVHLMRIWLYSMRSCMISYNAGHGIYSYGWDCFLTDNWLSGNGGAGYYADTTTAKATFTANRIEWNQLGGFVFKNCDLLNITGNCFDHNFGPALLFGGDGTEDAGGGITITGNIFERNGAAEQHSDLYCDSHIYIKRQSDISMMGNVFRTGYNDQREGRLKPSYGIVCGDVKHSVIKGNILHGGASKEPFTDLGGNEGLICGDNP